MLSGSGHDEHYTNDWRNDIMTGNYPLSDEQVSIVWKLAAHTDLQSLHWVVCNSRKG